MAQPHQETQDPTPFALSPDQTEALLRGGQAVLIDIREPEEISQDYIPQAQTRPLSLLQHNALLQKSGQPASPPPAPAPTPDTAVFFCRSGSRTKNNFDLLKQQGFTQTFYLDGGLNAWKAASKPVQTQNRALPLQRQIHIAAGSLILLLTIPGALAPEINGLRYLPSLIGAGLLFAGLSGTCGLGILLSKMPWNKR